VVIAAFHVSLHRSFSQRVRAAIDYNGNVAAAGMVRSRRRWRLSTCRLQMPFSFRLSKWRRMVHSELHLYVRFLPCCFSVTKTSFANCGPAKAWGIERPLFGCIAFDINAFPNARTTAVMKPAESLLDSPTRRFLIERVLPTATASRSRDRDGATDSGGSLH